MTCKSCGLEHRGWVSCDRARFDATSAILAAGINKEYEKPWDEVANSTPEVANTVANKHGVYADKEKRKAYMRDLMRKRRAK